MPPVAVTDERVSAQTTPALWERLLGEVPPSGKWLPYRDSEAAWELACRGVATLAQRRIGATPTNQNVVGEKGFTRLIYRLAEPRPASAPRPICRQAYAYTKPSEEARRLKIAH